MYFVYIAVLVFHWILLQKRQKTICSRTGVSRQWLHLLRWQDRRVLIAWCSFHQCITEAARRQPSRITSADFITIFTICQLYKVKLHSRTSNRPLVPLWRGVVWHAFCYFTADVPLLFDSFQSDQLFCMWFARDQLISCNMYFKASRIENNT